MRKNQLLQSILITCGFISLPGMGFSATKISIAQALTGCSSAGNKIAGTPIQSELKKQTSLIGMAYLNYIYQNDMTNPHFCQSMLLMNSQVPNGTDNPYVSLFENDMATKTMPLLAEIQLSFDYSIGRTNPPLEKLKDSVNSIKVIIKN